MINNRKQFLFALLLMTLIFPARALATAPNTVARLRIGVVEDGIYRIVPSDLTAAGIDLNNVDPHTFAMTSLGQPIAIRLTGDSDGRFDGNDVIEFYGEKYRGTDPDPLERQMQEKYTDERVYWLEIGGIGDPPRLSDEDASPSPQGSPTPPQDFADIIRAEESWYWFPLHTDTPDDKDTWFWKYITINANSQTESIAGYDIPYPTAGDSSLLRVVLHSRTYNDHRVKVSINSPPPPITYYIDEQWTGKNRAVYESALPAGLITHGGNDVHFTAINASSATDSVYVDYWELEYRRLFTAWQNQLDFVSEQNGPTEYVVDGWNAGDTVHIWDITNTAQPVHLFDHSSADQGSAQTVRFRAVNDQIGDNYWLQAESSILTPPAIALHNDAGLRYPAAGADVVIVTSTELRSAADQLASWHQNHGRRTLVVDFLVVADEFSDGIYQPQAVPAMMAWAQTNWPGEPPAYLILFGDGHWNFKSYNPASYPMQPQHIPPFLNFSDPWQGEVPVDAFYGDLDGDSHQDIAVGRIPVNDLTEAATVIQKIENYNEGDATDPWQSKAIFVADNQDSAGDFASVSDQIIENNLPGIFAVERIYLNVTVPDAAAGRAALTNAINDPDRGALMVQYAGHGAPFRWTDEAMWHKDYISDLTNASKLPVVMTFNCLDGYFAHPSPSYFAMAEEMVRYSSGGSVAALSPTGLGLTYDEHNFRQLLLDIIYKENNRSLGDALLQAKQRFTATYGYTPKYLLDTMTLFGDPTLLLTDACPGGEILPGVSIAQDGTQADLSWDSDGNSSFQVWRDTTPYFERDTGNDTPYATESTTGSHDANVIGDPTENFYYFVTASNSCEQITPPSQRVGEFDFALTPGQ